MQRSAWLALLLLLVSASSAVACLNDRETAVVEREFRSRYESPANPGVAGEIPQGNEHLSNLPIRDEWNIPIAVLGFLGFVFSIVAVIYTTPQVAPPSSRALVGRQRAIALCVVAIPTGCLLYGGLLVRGYIKLGGLRTQSITRPAAYELPKIPGGTSFRMAMLHDVLLERYLRHGQAWYEERNKESHAAIDEERAKPGPTTRMLDAMDDLAVGLENLHKSDEAAAVMEDKLTLLPAEVVKESVAPDLDADRKGDLDKEEAELQKIIDAAKMPPEMHQRYTTYANLGTSFIHGAFPGVLAGDAAAVARMHDGLTDIQKAIAINPGAHFGRETWQAVIVQHFLASLDHPDLTSRFDIIGDELSTLSPAEGDAARSRPDFLSTSADQLDATASIQDRVNIRFQILSLGISPEWSNIVNPDIPEQVHFDEPALALMGMWMLGGGPSPHSALAMADIAMQIGQQEIAWDGFERALEMKENFSPDTKVRQTLIDYCQNQQAAIAKFESPDAPDAWTATTRQRHVAELAWAWQYQDDYHAWEAKQIAAGVALDDPSFYTDFFKTRPSIASPVGHADEVETRFFAPDGVLDGIPAGLLVAGLFMLAGLLAGKAKR